jgi:hypothetical protein
MTTKYQDASSIVGSTFAAKLEEYERRLREKEKSEAANLILKSQARRRAALVEKYNVLLGVATSVQRTNERVEDVARGYGNWHEKERKLKLVVRAMLDDMDNLGLLGDPGVRKALHRRVNRLKKYCERVHVECLVEEMMNARREVAAIAADVKMRKVLFG